MRIFQKTVMTLLLLMPVLLMANTTICTADNVKPEVGDVLIISEPTGITFQHVYFPKANIIHKRTGVVNYKLATGMKVTVTEIEEKDGRMIVTLKPIGNRKFFRFWRSVKADYQAALDTGELTPSLR